MSTVPTLHELDEAQVRESTLFDSLARLVPEELQTAYYRVLAHTPTLSPDDEMLRILEAMGILAWLTRHTPKDIADERERIEKHEALTVTGVSGASIHTMNERGEEKSVSLTQARSFSVHERAEIEIAAGDKLLMMGNRKEPGFRATNGELTAVRSVERGIINLEDGRSVPANYREFTHGYAVTAHRSQGKTVDHVIVSADVMKQELFYVAASRGREGISIVTSDVEHLGESLGVSMARPSAIELANELSQSKQSPEHHAEMNPKQVNEALKPPHDIGFEYGMGLEL